MLVTLAMMMSKQDTSKLCLLFIQPPTRIPYCSAPPPPRPLDPRHLPVVAVNSLYMPSHDYQDIFLNIFFVCRSPLDKEDRSRRFGGVVGVGNLTLQRVQKDWCRGSSVTTAINGFIVWAGRSWTRTFGVIGVLMSNLIFLFVCLFTFFVLSYVLFNKLSFQSFHIVACLLI